MNILSEKITIRLPRDEAGELRREATENGISLSDHIRSQLAEAAANNAFDSAAEMQRKEFDIWKREVAALIEIRSLLRHIAKDSDIRGITEQAETSANQLFENLLKELD